MSGPPRGKAPPVRLAPGLLARRRPTLPPIGDKVRRSSPRFKPRFNMDSLALGKLKLLVADDDANLREALGEFFVREGFLVELASSGIEAIELLRRGFFDVSILDGHMPGLSGPQVLRRLLDDAGPMAIPPTVLVSSDVSIETWVAAWSRERLGRNDGRLAANGIGFVPKPIRLDALRRSIQLLLEQRPPHSSSF